MIANQLLFVNLQALIFAPQGPDAHESMGTVYDVDSAVCV